MICGLWLSSFNVIIKSCSKWFLQKLGHEGCSFFIVLCHILGNLWLLSNFLSGIILPSGFSLFLGLNNLLMAYEDKSAYALCAFSFALGPESEPITFLGKTLVCFESLLCCSHKRIFKITSRQFGLKATLCHFNLWSRTNFWQWLMSLQWPWGSSSSTTP